MTLPSFNRFAFGRDPVTRADMEAFIEFLEEMLGPLLDNPANDTNFIGDVQLGTGGRAISHQLGRQLLGWKLTRLDTDANVWESQPPDNTFLYLQASTDCTVSIEVF